MTPLGRSRNEIKKYTQKNRSTFDVWAAVYANGLKNNYLTTLDPGYSTQVSAVMIRDLLRTADRLKML